jgi:site-specific DNA recombinase
MTTTNGHGSKRVILYARVSTDEQARSGYSLAQQLGALREYAAREGYEVLEEVTDEGCSGASLARPGLDHVRDVAASGSIDLVLAQDRDRFARKVVLNGLLDEELSKHGCKTKALTDYGDDSPEGALMRGIQTQFAEYERAKIAERTRRGKERKAREGKVLRGSKPPFGFRYNAAGDGLVVHEPEMVVTPRIFRMAAEGMGPQAIQTRLFEEGTPSPTGDSWWPRRTLEQILRSDPNRPHTFEEIAELVSAEVLARLDDHTEYGVWWFGRKSTTEHSISEPDGNGGRRYRKATTTRIRPKEERTAVPVPAYLPRGLVEQVRATLATNRPPERKRLARQWELRGLLRCSCGWKMATHTSTSKGNGADYHYYVCKQRKERRRTCDCTQRAVRATEAERAVWDSSPTSCETPRRSGAAWRS